MVKLKDFEITHAAKFEFYSGVDEFRARFSAATDSLYAVLRVMELGELDDKTYANAVYGVLCQFQSLCAELDQMVEADGVVFPCVMVKEGVSV